MPKRDGNGNWIIPKRVIWGFISAIIFLLFTTAWGWKDDLGQEKLQGIKAEIKIVQNIVKKNRTAMTINTEFRIDTNRRLQNIEQRLDAIAHKLGVSAPPK